MRQMAQIIEELHRQAAVKAHQVADFGDCLLGRRRAGEVHRRIARQCAGQQKGHDDDAGDARQRRGEATQHKHVSASSAST